MNKPFFFTSAVILLIFNSASVQAKPLQDAASTPAKVKQLYERDCAMCHGANGDGKTDIARDRQLLMSDWTDPKSLSVRTDQQLFTLIRNGKGQMPAESDGRVSNDDLRSLIQYIRGMAKVRPAAREPNAPAPSAASTPPAPKE